MKIQNKSAKLWITLGLLGLILFGIRSVTGPFGGVIVEMFSDAGIIFLLVGFYLESRSKKKDNSKGFIPLAVAIIIGLLAVAGGTTALVLSKRTPVEAPKQPERAPTKDVEVQGVSDGVWGKQGNPGGFREDNSKANS